MIAFIPPILYEPPPDCRQWECRACRAWCETEGKAAYCPKCGSRDIIELVGGPPWSLRKKLIVFGVVAVGLVGAYLLLAWFAPLFSTFPWQVKHWWPFNNMAIPDAWCW